MPFYKGKPLGLVEKPKDLKSQELVFQIRFTKEIFRNYDEYLNRINLYRSRVWKCKATGKGNLTYEEALDSEKKSSERVQKIPIELVTLVLRDVQFSMLSLKDLVKSIAAKFQGPFSEGAELYGRKEGHLRPCKIIRVLEDSSKTRYEIAWIGSDHQTSGTKLVDSDDLTAKNPPFSKRFLQSFIKDSTYRRIPWVLHDDLAKKHGISTTPPEELKKSIIIQDGLVVCSKKRKRKEEDKVKIEEASGNEIRVYKRKNGGSASSVDELPEAPSIKYPIDDLLVQPSEEDQLLTERPITCTGFGVPMDCVGNLLMVWDFLTSFGRLLNLSPFSLEEFENSVCYKDSTPTLIVEAHLILLRLLSKDNEKFSVVVENKERKPKIAWIEYLCDFLETFCASELSTHINTIKRGQYAILDTHVKLEIFKELVAEALDTDTVHDKLEESIEERHALAAVLRDEVLDEGRKKREEKEHGTKSEDHSSRNGEIDQGNSVAKKNLKNKKKKPKAEIDALEDGNSQSKRELIKVMKTEIKESLQMKSTAQRKEYIEREIEKRVIRNVPLGKDKNHNRYLFFQRDGRIFVENSDSTKWGYYQAKEELDALIGSMNVKGVRERALKKQLQKFYNKICLGIHKRSKEVAAQRVAMEDLVRRSDRVRSLTRENAALAFLKYTNRWKEH